MKQQDASRLNFTFFEISASNQISVWLDST